MVKNRITDLFQIKYPIIQAGMVWASGWRLASAVSSAGGLGIIGAGSMYPEVLKQHIQSYKQSTSLPFAVNVPLLYPDVEQLMDIIVKENVPIVFTSAGNPKTWTSYLKSHNIKVVHVVSSVKFALKSQAAGVDAVVAEGFEAGGHNGREETTTFTLIPMVRKELDIPLVAAGGIATGGGILAAMSLGADAVQIGTRFVASEEASSHINFKQEVIQSKEGDTKLTLKELAPVRLLKNKFYNDLEHLYTKSPTKEELKKLLGRARAKKGMFEGDLDEGELEIGQISGFIEDILPAKTIMKQLITEFETARRHAATLQFEH